MRVEPAPTLVLRVFGLPIGVLPDFFISAVLEDVVSQVVPAADDSTSAGAEASYTAAIENAIVVEDSLVALRLATTVGLRASQLARPVPSAFNVPALNWTVALQARHGEGVADQSPVATASIAEFGHGTGKPATLSSDRLSVELATDLHFHVSGAHAQVAGAAIGWLANRQPFEVTVAGEAVDSKDTCTLRRVMASFEYKHGLTFASSDVLLPNAARSSLIGLEELSLLQTTRDAARVRLTLETETTDQSLGAILAAGWPPLNFTVLHNVTRASIFQAQLSLLPAGALDAQVAAGCELSLGREWVERLIETIWTDLIFDRHSGLAFELDTDSAEPTVLREILRANSFEDLYNGISEKENTLTTTEAQPINMLHNLVLTVRTSTAAKLDLDCEYTLVLPEATATTIAGMTADLGTVDVALSHSEIAHHVPVLLGSLQPPTIDAVGFNLTVNDAGALGHMLTVLLAKQATTLGLNLTATASGTGQHPFAPQMLLSHGYTGTRPSTTGCGELATPEAESLVDGIFVAWGHMLSAGLNSLTVSIWADLENPLSIAIVAKAFTMDGAYNA
eukprot:SAG31_NODE_5087_length_2751_cov_2.452866_2_plen_565_part_00